MNINQNKKENDLIAEAYKQVTTEQSVPPRPTPASDGSGIAAYLQTFGEGEWTDQQNMEAKKIKELLIKRKNESLLQTDDELLSMARQSAAAMAKDRDTPSLGGGGMMGRNAVNTPDNSAPNVALNARGLPRPDMEPPPAPVGMVTTPPPPTGPTSGAFDTATKWVADNKPLAAGLGGAGAALLAAKLLKKKKKDRDDE